VRSDAFIYHGARDVRHGSITVDPGPDGMLVKVILCARCGTDQTIFRKGHPEVDKHAPIVLGHEMVGTIVDVGKEVRKLRDGLGFREGDRIPSADLSFRPGDRVIVQSRAARYANGLMLMSDPVTILSFRLHGAYSQYVRFTSELSRTGSVIRVPKGVSHEAAALAEPAACALESIYATPHPVGVDRGGRHLYRAGILGGGRCCIIGSGSVSMIYARLARLEGAAQLVILVRSAEKAALVQRLVGSGVSVQIVDRYSHLPLPEKLKAEQGIVSRMAELTQGHLFDDVVCACADPDAQRLMMALYCREGYAVGACFGGTHERVDAADVDLHHYRLAKTIGTSGCSTRTLNTVLRLLAEGELNLDGLIDPGYFSLEDDPAKFLDRTAAGLRPALDPWKKGVG
jgi:L-iditol 2-dehydrogenase